MEHHTNTAQHWKNTALSKYHITTKIKNVHSSEKQIGIREVLKIIVISDRAINDDCHTNIQYTENANQRMKNKDNERKHKERNCIKMKNLAATANLKSAEREWFA